MGGGVDRDEVSPIKSLTNCRNYPKCEIPAACKDFNEVLASVAAVGLKARFVIKDGDAADD